MMTLLILLILAACMSVVSGLRQGLMLLNVDTLQRKADLGDAQAEVLYSLRAYDDQLYLTLALISGLLGATIVVVLNLVLHPVLAVIVGTLLVLFFSEVLSRVFAERYSLRVAAKLAPYLGQVVVTLAPATSLLSRLKSHDQGQSMLEFQTKEELLTLIDNYLTHNKSDLSVEQLERIKHSLLFEDKTVSDHYIPKTAVISVRSNNSLNLNLLNRLHESGHSTFPVFDNQQVVGMLSLRDIVGLKDGAKTKVADVMSREVLYIHEADTLELALHALLSTGQPLLMVLDSEQEGKGIITIKDVVNQVFGRLPSSEFDRFNEADEVAGRKSVEAE